MPRGLSLATFLMLFAGVSAAAQSPGAGSSPAASPSQDSAQPAGTRNPKKVWTNENLSDTNGVVSIIGDPNNATGTKSNPAKPADSHYIRSVRKQLERLQTQIANTDKQITDLTNFSKGEPSPTSGIRLHRGYQREPIDVQIRVLQKNKEGPPG